MAKTYVSSAKYSIKISFEVSGAVDKPDIVGAIFGQSEGLLGDEMDLKELQKSGKIGRIEITHSNVLGKTRGEIIVPSSMDMVQTSLLAAAIESVDKVGPYDSEFKIITIDDVRTEKRQEIKTRAQELLEKFKEKILPDTVELTESLRENSRTADLVFYGNEKLPAGPEIEQSNEIIVVEGRADVINLLKNNIKNAIAMNGSQIPNAIIGLSKQKQITIFVDGDRGGTLIARNFLQIAKASFIAKAPDGKEVEELTRKEIIQSIRRKILVSEFLHRQTMQETPSYGMHSVNSRKKFPIDRPRRPRFGQRRDSFSSRKKFTNSRHHDFRKPFETQQPTTQNPVSEQDKQKFLPIMEQLKNSLKAKLFDKELKEIKEIPTKELVESLEKFSEVNTIVFDGIITKRLVETAEKKSVECIVGSKKPKTVQSKIKTIELNP